MKRQQSVLEEQLNAWTHGFGALMGIVGLILLILYTNHSQWNLFSVVLYGFSIILLFSASTLYHSVKGEKRKHYFRIIDHISIYVLIAGTYSPVTLITLNESLGWQLFWIVWAIAGFGLILKLFFTGKFEIFSTLLYLVMGWLIVFDFSSLSSIIGPNGVALLFAGGAFYTIGILFYAIERIPYNHVIWHLFVLAGAISHYLMIFMYVV
ncbi:hemolysin III family protein [Subsaxibacter sp. CAU 1640]|uniref:PAQR family membrane homeostasis protein TrhA n=1 Tax=Subsaxibacter sp. CAU 1640 TaxID=2933271 RepID=UPI00200476E3|nr:hemolysin III family protein [Subsaxibacter sp. CAU 1640]MCK7591156.1 hemolysin III family protein [Subsaxibacter sp. CAU 1640]